MNSKSGSHGISPRRPRRFFSLEPIPGIGEVLTLGKEEAHHLKKTLRLQSGDECLVTDGRGGEALATVEPFLGNDVRLKIKSMTLQPHSHAAANQTRVRMFVSMPQRGKMDSIVEKAQELGVEEIIPMVSAFSAFKISKDKETNVLSRWRRITQEASKQSGSPTLTKISSFVDFQSALNLIAPEELALFFHPGEKARSFYEWRSSFPISSETPFRFCGWIGPEGGFSDEEAALAFQKGMTQIELGPILLKVDTAFIATVSFLNFSF